MIRTLIVDDHDSMRRVIRALLERSGDIEIVGEARDGVQALQAIANLSPHVVVLDIFMRRMDGFQVLAALSQARQHPRVVMLSMNDSSDMVQRALAGGASAFVSKKMAHAELVEAVKSAAHS